MNVTHVEGGIDPIRDLEIINQELRIKDQEFLENTIKSLKTNIKKLGKLATKEIELETASKAFELLDKNVDVRLGTWSNDEVNLNFFNLFG